MLADEARQRQQTGGGNHPVGSGNERKRHRKRGKRGEGKRTNREK
jgi:hypothetical protein